MKSSNKTLIIFSAIHIYCTGVVAAKDALSTPQFMSMLNTCAAGSKTKFNGDLIGSVESLYQGQSTRGSATFSTETEFLNRLPEHQKFEGYRLYIECIKAIMLDPGKQKNALQIELMEHLSKDTPYSKITEAFGQPIKIKKTVQLWTIAQNRGRRRRSSSFSRRKRRSYNRLYKHKKASWGRSIHTKQ